MTSCCHRRRMRWSGATGAIARCKNRSTGYARKPRSVHAWRWTCGEKPKAKGANKPSTPYMKHGLAEATRYPCYSLNNGRRTHSAGICALCSKLVNARRAASLSCSGGDKAICLKLVAWETRIEQSHVRASESDHDSPRVKTFL